MAQLSVVVPLLDDVSALETTLVSVLSHRPADTEVLVVLGGRYDDPYQLAGEVRFIEGPRGAKLADSLNEAFAEADAPIVNVLACGVEVGEGWSDEPLEMFAEPDVAAVSGIVLDADDDQRVVAAGVQYEPRGCRLEAGAGLSLLEACREAPTVLGPSRWAGFYRRALVEDLGGFAPRVGDVYGDVDLALRIHHAGYRTELATGSRAYLRPGRPPRRGFRNGLAAERLFWRNAPVVGWTRSLLRHALALAPQMAAALLYPSVATELLGRALALAEAPLQRAHYRQLRTLIGMAEAELEAFAGSLSDDGRCRIGSRPRDDDTEQSWRRARSA